MNLNELSLILQFAILAFVPGCALLMLLGEWQNRPAVQQVGLALLVGISTYPVIFYALRPWATVQRPQLIGLLAIATAVILYFVVVKKARVTSIEPYEWIAICIFGLTFLTRFQFAHNWPYPAWSDSLHHTLLTQLTALSGQLPNSLEPYFPNGLKMYHLGLYSISGSLTILSNQPPHLTLLWSAQFLNAMCGIGVYLVLDRHVSRPAAIAGAAIAGLFSPHPGLWSNWGRFTQLASIVILPVAWLYLIEVLQNRSGDRRWQPILLAGFLSAAVFLMHFRVAGFYVILVVPTIIWALKYGSSSQRQVSTAILGIGFLGLIFILPVLPPAVEIYLENAAKSGSSNVDQATAQATRDAYYLFPLSVYPYLVAPVWLLIVATVATIIGIGQRQWLSWLMLSWVIGLMVIGNLYVLNIPILNFTNLGAVLIMLYIPIALLIGVSVEQVCQRFPHNSRGFMTTGLLLGLLAACGPAAFLRATRVEPFRHFMTENDRVAMNWINDNLPENAVFAINSYFWFPSFAHGTDAGYWIPYWTGRDIVLTSMISAESPEAYRDDIKQWSLLAEQLESNSETLDDLYFEGIEYIYIGTRGDFSGKGLQLDQLLASNETELLFQLGDTAILQITPNNDSE